MQRKRKGIRVEALSDEKLRRVVARIHDGNEAYRHLARLLQDAQLPGATEVNKSRMRRSRSA